MDQVKRRGLLKKDTNTNKPHDYIVDLKDMIHPLGLKRQEEVTIWLRYVPDQTLIVPEAYSEYLHCFELEHFSEVALEKIAGMILEDLSDVFIPCWIHLHLAMRGGTRIQHQVTMEDRQPGWSSPELLDRLRPI